MFSAEENDFLRKFKRPYDIQLYLNELTYDAIPGTGSPRVVMRERKANCFEGALFAAAALRFLGHKPVVLDIMAQLDDDHVIALFKKDGRFGAVTKSNTTVLRYREPVYQSVRELAMSYFDMYFNVKGKKSMRSYSNPVDLSRFDAQDWMTTEANLDFIGDYLTRVKHHSVLTRAQLRNLSPVDTDLVKVCFAGSVEEGLFDPDYD